MRRRGRGTEHLQQDRRTESVPTILSEDECKQLLERVLAFARGGGNTDIAIKSWWHGELRWARNRTVISSGRRNIEVTVRRWPTWSEFGTVRTNQIDDVSLEAAVRAAERAAKYRGIGVPNEDYWPQMPEYNRPPSAQIWSDATAGLGINERAEVARAIIAPAEAEGLQSAGYLEVRAAASASYSTIFREHRGGEHGIYEQPYIRWTQAQCSTTVRDAAGMGSGWAGLSSYDWNRISGQCDALANRAVQKCKASRNPVALEPGRYTVILEPQAVADLMEVLVIFLHREEPESAAPRGPWHLTKDEATGLSISKMGIRVVDERISIEHDPMDPRLGIVMGMLERPGPVSWIKNGVLTRLGHGWTKAMEELNGIDGRHTLRAGTGYHISGGETSIEDMIKTTRRGLLVTRFSNIKLLDRDSLLSTGLTRDGLWLIENGEITKAVKNFRFTESPLFVLNNIEQLGESVPVFRPTKQEGDVLTPAIVPPIKARDFSFTSLIDAV